MAKPTAWKDPEDAFRAFQVMETILPWFEWRMSYDCWSFGLLLTTGDVVAIDQLGEFRKDSSGRWWVDVTLKDKDFAKDYFGSWQGKKIICAPTSRTKASIAVDQIVMGVELADT